MKRMPLFTLNRSWLAVLVFLFVPGLSLLPLARVQPAANHLPIIQLAPAKPGDLDPTFGDQGIVQADPGGSIAVQFDGKILVAGSTGAYLKHDFALARYNADGSIDATFGNGGRIVTDFDGRDDSANAVAIQPDGKILLAGSSDSSIALARYSSKGDLDPAFGESGKVLPLFDGNELISEEVIDITLQADGKIIAASSPKGYDRYGALTRFNPDGSIDTTFGSSGIVIVNSGDSSQPTDVLVQTDGRIVVVGRLFGRIGSVRSAFLARFFPNGSLDRTVVYGFPHGYSQYMDNDSANAIILQSSGKFVIAGNTGGTDNQGSFHDILAMARFTAAGVLDTSFGDQGFFLLNGLTNSWGSDIQIQSDGKLLVSGKVENSAGGSDFLLARFTPDGALDPSFGQGGLKLLDVEELDDQHSQIVPLRDGRILLAGTTNKQDHSEQHFILARLLNDVPALVPRIWFPVVGHP